MPKGDKTELMEKSMALIERLGHHVGSDDPHPWLALDLTIAQLKSLFFINFGGATSSKNLAEALGVTPPNVTGIIDRLVEQGLVTREYNRQNRRTQIIRLTDKGTALLNELRMQRTARFSSLIAALNMEDLAALVQGLTALTRVVEKNLEDQNKQSLITE